MFEAVCGTSFQGDIAIDDITILNSPCATLPAPAVPPTVPPTPPMPVNCTFERGFCNWNNLKTGDQFDWTRHRGGTYSTNTGPSIDHTTSSTRGKEQQITTRLVILTNITLMKPLEITGGDDGSIFY